MQKTNNQKLTVILGLASALTLGGLSYLIYKYKQKPTSKYEKLSQTPKKPKINRNKLPKKNNLIDISKLSKETLRELYIELLKDQLQQFHPIIDELEQITRYLKEQAHAKGQDPRPDEIYMTIMQNQGIQNRMLEKENEVYTKHLLDKEEFTKQVQEKLENDAECKRILEKTHNLISAASSGINLCEVTPVPAILTAEKSFEITQHIMLLSNVYLQKELININVEKGKIDLEDEENQKRLRSIDVTNIREKVFQDENIDDLEDPPTRVIRAAVFKYMTEFPETYAAKLKELEQIHQQCYKSLLQEPLGVRDFKAIYNLKFTQ